MTKFEEYLEGKRLSDYTSYDWARLAWNAGIEAAKIEARKNLDDFGFTAPSDLDHLLEGNK